MARQAITLFSWGYWGWGNATRQLVDGVDAVEAARDFAPPLFVDIRYSRSVRAPGFRDHVFEHTLGDERYHWMKNLGNKAIATHTGPRIQIVEPGAAVELLELAIESSKRDQRVIFFCACLRPVLDLAGDTCHRVEAARLVCDAARKKGARVELVEWPGEEPTTVKLEIPGALLKQVRNGRKFVPIPKPVDIARFAGLPWGSCLDLKAGDDEWTVLSGPAMFTAKQWQLPVCELPGDLLKTPTAREKAARRFRKAWGYEPME